jgi:type II secretory pathway pseudopilin PulG
MRQRGFGILESLIGLTIIALVLCAGVVPLMAVLRVQSETQVQAVMQTLMTAESTYYNLNGGYATGAQLSACSTCFVSPALTGSTPFNQYLFTYETFPSGCTTACTSYLINASPQLPAYPLTYCGDSDSTLLHAGPTGTGTWSTLAGCDAEPAVAQGATTIAATVPLYSTSASGLNIANDSIQLLMSLPNLPAGTYMITARVTAQWPSLPTTTNIGIRCDLLNSGNELSPANIVESEGSASSSDPNYTTVTVSGPITITAGQTPGIGGFNWGTATSSQMSGWNGVMTAIPVQNAGN